MKIKRAPQQATRPQSIDTKEPALECPSCSCQFFSEKRVCRYKKDHTVVHGQGVPQADPGVWFVLLECARCSQLVEPELLSGRSDTPAKLYNIHLTELEDGG